jgi:hypothetical protein
MYNKKACKKVEKIKHNINKVEHSLDNQTGILVIQSVQNPYRQDNSLENRSRATSKVQRNYYFNSSRGKRSSITKLEQSLQPVKPKLFIKFQLNIIIQCGER